jgi:hypothetical protein
VCHDGTCIGGNENSGLAFRIQDLLRVGIVRRVDALARKTRRVNDLALASQPQAVCRAKKSLDWVASSGTLMLKRKATWGMSDGVSCKSFYRRWH